MSISVVCDKKENHQIKNRHRLREFCHSQVSFTNQRVYGSHWASIHLENIVHVNNKTGYGSASIFNFRSESLALRVFIFLPVGGCGLSVLCLEA